MSPIIKNVLRLAVPLAALLLSACGGQRDPGEALARYTVSGAVSGLTGTLVLQNNGGDNITVTADGNFTFSGKFSSGSTYAVTVLTQPASQTCSVSTGAGTVSGNNVSNVIVTCSTNSYTVGGAVSGLTGTVVLQNNNGDNLTVSANGAFTFATAVAQGSPYAVTVMSQPSGQNCSVANGTGTIAGANISNVAITCAANMFTVGGTVSGLSGTVVLQNNSGDNLTISTNGNFTFASAISDGGTYTVTVLIQPIGQTCSVSTGAGTISGNNVSNVTVTCSANAYTVGGTVSGLSGTVVLQNNSGDNLTISTNGNFTFASAISDGGAYTVTVLTQPTGQTCTVSAGAGTVSGGNVTGIALVCTINTFEVVVDAGATGGGTWSGTNPDVFTSNASVATVSVTDIQSRLNAGIPVTIATSPAALGNGDISVSSTASWSANTLTLKARRNITFNAALNGSGTAGLALEYGQGAVAAGNTGTYKVNAPVNLASTGSFSTKPGSDGAVTSYTILTSLGAAGSVTTTDLQGMNGNLAGKYVLGANIAASGTSTWNGGAGFTPVGGNANLPATVPHFTGSFDGLGHTITGLTINNAGTDFQGLFGYSTGILRNVGLLNSSVNGRSGDGMLAGFSTGAISYSYAEGGSVTSNWGGSSVGGLHGGGTGSISYSYANVSVTSDNSTAGGLAGNAGAISNSYATGSVHGNTDSIGGLVGQVNGAITNSYATGAVTAAGGATNVGGLLGKLNGGGSASNSYWNTQTSGRATSAGAAVGKTTAEMKTQATFSGWDFVGTWKIVEGVSYPTLR